MECQLTEGDAYSTQRTHCRPKWVNDNFRRAYLQSLQSALTKLPVTKPDEDEPENAQAVINSQCSILGKAMHQAAYAGLSRDGNIRRVHWWSNDCTTYRNRTRVYFHIIIHSPLFKSLNISSCQLIHNYIMYNCIYIHLGLPIARLQYFHNLLDIIPIEWN